MKNTSTSLKSKELPIVGSGLAFGKDPLEFLDKVHKEFGDYAEFTLFGKHYVAIYSPELIDQVFIKKASSYIKSEFVREKWKGLFGRGIFTAEGEEWKRSRRSLQPYMSRDKLVKYFDVILSETKRYRDTLSNHKEINVKNDMMRVMLFSLVKVLFHSELKSKEIERFGTLFEVCQNYFDYTMTPRGMLLHNFPTPTKRGFEKAIKELEGMIESSTGSTDPNDVNMLSTLKNTVDENGVKLTPKHIRDNVLSFFIAGHETSSLSIVYTLFLLAQYPEELKIVQDEIDSICGDQDPTYEQLEKLVRLKAVINESMRVYPPVGLLGREAISEDQIGEIKIEKGTNIVIPVLAIHRSPHLFEKPLEFIPDRWMNTESSKKPGFIPFGTGPRVCMGASFAMMEITAVLAIMLQKYEVILKSSPHLKLMTSGSMRPINDVILEVIERK